MPADAPRNALAAPPTQSAVVEGARKKAGVGLVAIAATAVAGFVAVGSPAAGASSPTSVIVRDDMQRTVAAGFGSAAVGGAYTVTSKRWTSVTPGTGFFVVAPGRSTSVQLAKVSALNVTARLTFAVPSQSAAGSGVFVTIQSRRQVRYEGYGTKVQIQPGGRVSLGFYRLKDGAQLGKNHAILTAAPGELLTVETQISGRSPVRLAASVWAGTTSSPHAAAWQNVAKDSSQARTRTAGRLQLMTYLSRHARSAVREGIKNFKAWSSTSSTPSRGPAASPEPTTQTPDASASSGTAGSGSSSRLGPPAGSALPGTTDYPRPSGAVYVAPGGIDTAAGTESAPWRTLAHAISAVRSGSTIVLRAGSYNESVTVQSNKTLTIQAFPRETVWLDGSTPVGSWTRSGNTWIHQGWTAHFSSLASYTKTVSTAPNFGFVNAAHPMAAHPDQVWFGSDALSQVGSAAATGPGEFFADYANDQLVVGSNPAGQDVTASNLSVAFTSYGRDVVLRGIGVRKYATAVGDMGAVRLAGGDDVVENVTTQGNATTGLAISSTGVRVRNVTASGNGMLGVTAAYSDGLVVTGLRAAGNNTEHFNTAPVSGGLKITRTRSVTVRGSAFLDNRGVGVWFDESCYDFSLTGNYVANNASNGAVVEISSTGVVADNTITGSGAIGLKINDADHVEAWNNTIMANASQVQIVEDARRGAKLGMAGHDPRQHQPDPTEPWIISNDTLMNNVIGQARSGSSQLTVRDYSGEFTAAQLKPIISGNVFVGPAPGRAVTWGIGAGVAIYPSVAEFQARTGQRGNATAATTSGTDRFAGLALPRSVASVAGRPAGSTHVGAF